MFYLNLLEMATLFNIMGIRCLVTDDVMHLNKIEYPFITISIFKINSLAACPYCKCVIWAYFILFYLFSF